MIYRLATKDDEEEIKKIWRYAFESTKNQYVKPTPPELDELSTYPTQTYIAEINNKIVAGIAVIDFKQRIRGTWIKMAGIFAVACRPEYRRKKHITQLFVYVFQKLHNNEYLVSALYPFLYSFYEKVGYAHVDNLQSYTVRCDNIKKKPIPSRIIEEDYDPNYSRCHPIYHKMAEKIDGLVQRPSSVWKGLLGWNWKKGGFQFICKDLAGNDLGYIIIRFEKKTLDRDYAILEVKELVCFDPETKQAFLNFLANHDSQRTYVTFVPIDSNYLLYMKNPNIKEKRDIANSMFRVIDVEKLLPQLNYPQTLTDEINFTVKDLETHCPWNNRTFILRIKRGNGQLTLSQTKSNLQISINALNQIIFGLYSPKELAEVGKVTGDEDELVRLGQIFPKQHATLRDFF